MTLAAPVPASAMNSSASVGAAAAAMLRTPNASAAMASSLYLIVRRAPAVSAPITAPAAIAVVSAA